MPILRCSLYSRGLSLYLLLLCITQLQHKRVNLKSCISLRKPTKVFLAGKIKASCRKLGYLIVISDVRYKTLRVIYHAENTMFM